MHHHIEMKAILTKSSRKIDGSLLRFGCNVIFAYVMYVGIVCITPCSCLHMSKACTKRLLYIYITIIYYRAFAPWKVIAQTLRKLGKHKATDSKKHTFNKISVLFIKHFPLWSYFTLANAYIPFTQMKLQKKLHYVWLII